MHFSNECTRPDQSYSVPTAGATYRYRSVGILDKPVQAPSSEIFLKSRTRRLSGPCTDHANRPCLDRSASISTPAQPNLPPPLDNISFIHTHKHHHQHPTRLPYDYDTGIASVIPRRKATPLFLHCTPAKQCMSTDSSPASDRRR